MADKKIIATDLGNALRTVDLFHIVDDPIFKQHQSIKK